MFLNFSDELKKVLIDARKEMCDLNQSFIGTEHIVLSILCKNNEIRKILNKYNITYNEFKEKIIELVGYGNETNSLFVFTPLVKKILEDVILLSQDNKTEISLNSFFIALLDSGEGVAYRIFCSMNINIDDMYKIISNDNSRVIDSKYLYEVGVDLNKLANNSRFDPVIGRDFEMSQVIEILLRKTKCNPLLVGPAGVGKTAIVEGLVQRIIDENVPYKLLGKKIVSLSMASLVSGTKYRGEFEEKLINIIKEAENNPNIIIFIDEIHTLVGAGGSDGAIDASNILKPALSRGNIKIIGATTTEEYKKYIEDDKALSRRFQVVNVAEPSYEVVIEILNKLKKSYEKFHNVVIDDDILIYIINITKKYLFNRKEPDRSIDIFDEVCSKVSSSFDDNELMNIQLKKKLKDVINIKNNYLFQNNYKEALNCREIERELESKINNSLFKETKIKKVTKQDVDIVVGNKIGLQILDEKMGEKFFNKKFKKISSLVLGQNEIIMELLREVRKIFISRYNINKPVSVIFSGKKGVGKNYLLEIIGKELFNNVIRINLNEFSDSQSINKIIGSSPGYTGFGFKKDIFESLKEKPAALIIFDNFNSCCSDVKKIIYQIVDTGNLIDSCGYRYCFNNCLIVFTVEKTNNICVGFNNNCFNYSNKYLFDKVTKVFNFNDLNKNEIKEIVKKKINDKIDNKTVSKIINESNYLVNGCSKIDLLVEKYNLSLI